MQAQDCSVSPTHPPLKLHNAVLFLCLSASCIPFTCPLHVSPKCFISITQTRTEPYMYMMDRAAIARLTMMELFQLIRLCLEEMMSRTDAAPAVRNVATQVPGTPEPSPGTPDAVPSCNWYCSSPFCQQRCQQRDPLHIDHLCPSHRHWRD